MKKISLVVLFFTIIMNSTTVFAKDKGNAPHPNAKAYEHANENARFKRDGVTPKLSEEERKALKKQRIEAEIKAKKEFRINKRKAFQDKKEAEQAARKAAKRAERSIEKHKDDIKDEQIIHEEKK